MITIEHSNGTEVFRGKLLGYGSSEQDKHNHSTDYVAAGEDPRTGHKIRCSACRWQVAYIYDDLDTGDYVVYTQGVSIIPGERTYDKFTRTDSPMMVREALTVRKPTSVFMPAPAKHALAKAAEMDADLREIYDTLPAGL